MPNSEEILGNLQRDLSAANATWTARLTTLLQLPENERRSRLGYVPGPDELSLQAREERSAAQLVALRATAPGAPPAYDQRNVNGRSFVTSIKDQGSCGSCVAFGTAATLEGTARVLTDIAVNDAGAGVMPNLSEAQLFYCGGAKCASGWYVDAAMSYAVTNGVAPDSCFPYSPGDQSCQLCTDWKAQITQPSAYHWISDPTAMKAWLSSNGPLIACFSVYADFYGYGGGVYRHVSGDYEGGHCISVIGYDDTQGAWLCKNSWGSGWGESGFFWIAYGQCGIDASMTAVDSFSHIYPLYDDFYLRGELDDVGEVPQQGGGMCTSPDIIPVGSTPLPDPQTTLSKGWRQDLGTDVLAGQQNYVYVRAKNLKAGANNGQAALYYTRASLILWPDQWSQNELKTEAGASSSVLAAGALGDVAVGAAPFVWTPAALPDNDHYCLIARASTTAHPNPIPGTFGSMDDWVTFIRQNPGFGWRNVALVTRDTPTFQTNVQLSVPNACELYVLLEADNIPVGAAMQFTCGTPGPSPELVLPKTTINMPNMVAGVYSNVPAGFASAITLSFWSNGLTIPSGASLTLSAFYVPPTTSPHREFAKPIPYPGIEPVAAILVGSYRVNFQ